MKIKWIGLLIVAALGCIVYSGIPTTAAENHDVPVVKTAVAEPIPAAQYFQPAKPVAEEQSYTEAEGSPYELCVREYIPLDPDVQIILFSTCDAAGVDYAIALGLIQVESTFDPEAFNEKSKCYGLCQLNPAYFPSDLTPAENVQTGITYLGEQLRRYNGDLAAALTAYNAGHDTGNRWYANLVLEAAEKWMDLK